MTARGPLVRFCRGRRGPDWQALGSEELGAETAPGTDRGPTGDAGDRLQSATGDGGDSRGPQRKMKCLKTLHFFFSVPGPRRPRHIYKGVRV
jgi:hypothetical protein